MRKNPMSLKKLNLSRETVRNLDMLEALKDVEGGIISSDNKWCTYSQRCETIVNCA